MTLVITDEVTTIDLMCLIESFSILKTESFLRYFVSPVVVALRYVLCLNGCLHVPGFNCLV